MKHITLEPNYTAMFQQFKKDAMIHMSRFADRQNMFPAETTFTRSEVYSFIASLRIALSCITKGDQVVALREEFDAGAEKIFAVLNEENFRREYSEFSEEDQ